MKNNLKLRLSTFFCTIFMIGNIKYMPGTFGSLVGVLVGINFKNLLPITIYLSIIIIITIIAVLAIDIYQNSYGKEDRSEIIIDEFIGQQIPLLFIELTLINIMLSFLFFRFFDIFKIFPCNYVDNNFKNSIGVITDDLIAGIQAIVVIYLINLLL